MRLDSIRWLLLVVALVAGTALAQRTLTVAPAAANDQRVALVIGNSSYKEAPLRNPVNDATDMATTLRDLGFTVTLRTNADVRQMRTAIREFAQNLRKGGVGLFYFAGHGVQSRNGRNYLVPVNSDIKEEFELEDEAVDANRVLAGMEEAGNRVNIVILDACRNNPFARSWRSAASGLAQMSAPTGSFVGFATAPGSVAADGTGRNGIYTKHLIENLRQGDPDIDRVFTRVTAAVAKETGNKQVPWKSSSLTGDFQFRNGVEGAQVATIAPLPPLVIPAETPPVVSPPVDRSANDRALWEAVRDSRNPEEIRAYVDQFPEGLFVAVARARIKAMEATQVASLAPPPPAAPLPPLLPPNTISAMKSGEVFRDCADCPEMVVIPAGSFLMGSPSSESARTTEEGPQTSMNIARAYAMGKFEVTFDEWDACVREGGCTHRPADQGWGRGRRPVINVSWHDASAYAEWLSRKTGKRYRLPSEAEWEYAARAGTTTPYSTGMSITPNQANFQNRTFSLLGGEGSVNRQTMEVGRFSPNAFGLHDVHGNVWEWTQDCISSSDYSASSTNGSPVLSGDCGQRRLRGGSWNTESNFLRSAGRSRTEIGNRGFATGFRLARSD